MVKYSELRNVKFTLRIVAQFLCGCGPTLARMIVVPEWLWADSGQHDCGSIPVWLWADSGQNDCGTRVAPWLNLTFPNLF